MAVVLMSIAGSVVLSGCSDGTDTYTAKLTDVESAGLNEMVATVKVHNNTSTAATPSDCWVNLYDAGGKKVGNHGSWTTKKPVPAHASTTVVIVVDVPIAQQVDVRLGESEATCLG